MFRKAPRLVIAGRPPGEEVGGYAVERQTLMTSRSLPSNAKDFYGPIVHVHSSGVEFTQ